MEDGVGSGRLTEDGDAPRVAAERGDVACDPAERGELVEALANAASPASWEHLRTSRGLSVERARDVMRRSALALLRDAGVET